MVNERQREKSKMKSLFAFHVSANNMEMSGICMLVGSYWTDCIGSVAFGIEWHKETYLVDS